MKPEHSDPLNAVIVTFGKHKGLSAARMKRLDPQYFKWAMENVGHFADKIISAKDNAPNRLERLPGQKHDEYLQALLRSALAAGVSPLDGPAAKELRPYWESYLAEHHIESISPESHPLEACQLDPKLAPF